MTNQHEERKRKADERAEPQYFFTYVLQMNDGAFYVGSTNAPLARWTEHAVGVGAKATKDHQYTVRMAMPFLSRKEAEYNERRVQAALDRGSDHIEGLLSVYEQMIAVVRPPKTFSELYEEEQKYTREMETVFHHSKAVMGQGWTVKTACGWAGRYYSTQDWDVLKKDARDEDFTGNIYGRKVCRRCLEYAPAE